MDEASPPHHIERPRQYRGSRKHVLDWTSRESFSEELLALIHPVWDDNFVKPLAWMPRGYREPDEARIHRFGREVWPDHSAWPAIEDWWLTHKRGANTPNWDLVLAAEVSGQPALILVEAKAHVSELKEDGKSLDDDASSNSSANHERIVAAIGEACTGLRGADERVAITHASHYQLANRVAFTWKLAGLGISTALVYLGFIGDNGIADVGLPFKNEAHWLETFSAHSGKCLPKELLERRVPCGACDAWFTVRSRIVIEQSPPRE
jgi:hypothetical protein